MVTANSVPSRFITLGITFSVRGQPRTRGRRGQRTRIEVLLLGRYAPLLRQHPDIRTQGMRALFLALRMAAPVDTGMLKASIRQEVVGRSPTVTLGPEPYDRGRLKAALAGRTQRRRRRRGRRRLSGYYALYANERSRRPRYLERSMTESARQMVQLLKQAEEVQSEEQAALAEQLRLNRLLGRI